MASAARHSTRCAEDILTLKAFETLLVLVEHRGIVNLNNRLTRLERTLTRDRCDCDDNIDLSWPGHQPHEQCDSCGGERLIAQLHHDPGRTEPRLRAALPLLARAYDGQRFDYTQLSDDELQQVKAALEAAENTRTQTMKR